MIVIIIVLIMVMCYIDKIVENISREVIFFSCFFNWFNLLNDCFILVNSNFIMVHKIVFLCFYMFLYKRIV